MSDRVRVPRGEVVRPLPLRRTDWFLRWTLERGLEGGKTRDPLTTLSLVCGYYNPVPSRVANDLTVTKLTCLPHKKQKGPRDTGQRVQEGRSRILPSSSLYPVRRGAVGLSWKHVSGRRSRPVGVTPKEG